MNKEYSVKKIIAAVLTALAFVAVLYGINGTVLAPLPHLRPESPSWIASYDGGIVISDLDNSRLIFTDDSLRVVRASKLDSGDSPIDVVNSITADGSHIYVTGAKTVMRGGYYSSETVVEYSPDGKYIRELFREEYGDDDFVSAPRFQDLLVKDGSMRLAAIREDGSLEVLSVSPGRMETLGILRTGYDIEKAKLWEDGSGLAWQNIYRMCRFDGSFSAESISFDDAVSEICDRYGLAGEPYDTIGLATYLPLLPTLSDTTLHYGGEECLFYTADEGLYRYGTESGENEHITELALSPQLFTQYAVFWLAVLWLSALLVIACIRAMKKADRKKLATVLLVILVASGISFFYTYRAYRKLEQEYIDRLIAQCSQIRTTIIEPNIDIIEETSVNGMQEFCSSPENLDRIDEIEDRLSLFIAANGKEDSFNAGIDVIHDGKLWGLAFSDYTGQTGNDEYDYDVALGYYPSLKYGGSGEAMMDGVGYYIYSDNIYNSEGNHAALLYVGFSNTHLKESQRQEGLDMFVTLLVIMIAVYTCLSTFRKFGATITEYRRKQKMLEGIPKLPLLCGIAAFICTVICQFDSVVLVFAAKSLSTGMSSLQAAKFAALPISLYSFGLMSGSTVAGFSVRKLGERGATIVACIVGTLALFAAAFALKTGSLPVFTAAKFIEGLTVAGVAYSTIYSAPFGLADKDEQRRIYTDCQTASASAGLIGVFAGGYISEYLSYTAIFTVKAILTIALGIVCFMMFEGGRRSTAGTEETGRGEGWSFYLKPKPLLLYLGAIFPIVAFGGYRGYLFPIYSENAGLSTVMLSNISIISRFLALAATGVISGVCRRYDSRKVLVGSVGITALCFILFIVSPNIRWAIAVLFISNVLIRSGNVTASFYTSELCEEYGYDMKKVQICSDSIRGIINTAGPPILSLFLTLGDNMACAAVGAVCLALLIIFALFTRGRKASAQPIPAE